MIDYLNMVRQFHNKYGHFTSSKLTTQQHMPHEVVRLRERLITEEAEEFEEASYGSTDVADIADALADILYVTFGAALAYGIPIDEVFKEVHRSNMTKSMLKSESIKGKTIKGDDYEPPNLKEILERAAK